MAIRYWVGGTGDWDGVDTSHWSASSGGAGGASVPTSADDVIFNGSSGGGTCTGSFGVCKSLTCTGYTGTLNTDSIDIYGDIVLSSGMSVGAFFSFYVKASMSLTSAGKTFYFFQTDAGTSTLADALNIRALVLSGGVFDTANFALNVRQITLDASTTLTLGSSLVTFSGFSAGEQLFDFSAGTLTLSANTSTIKVTTSGGKLNLNGLTTWNNIWSAVGAAGSLEILGGGTVADLKADANSTLYFGASQTVVATSFTFTGTAGNLITLRSTSNGSTYTLSKSSGTVTADYCDIKDSIATGGAAFRATNSVNSGHNTGWNFGFGGLPPRAARATYLRM